MVISPCLYMFIYVYIVYVYVFFFNLSLYSGTHTHTYIYICIHDIWYECIFHPIFIGCLQQWWEDHAPYTMFWPWHHSRMGGWTSIQKKQLNFCLNIENSRGFHWPTAMCKWWSNMGIIINQWGVIDILSWWFPIDWWLMMGMGRCCTWSEFWLLHFNIQLQVSIWVHPYIGNQLATWEWCLQLSFCLVFVALFWGPAWNHELTNLFGTHIVVIFQLVPLLYTCWKKLHQKSMLKTGWSHTAMLDQRHGSRQMATIYICIYIYMYIYILKLYYNIYIYGSTGSIVDLKNSLR